MELNNRSLVYVLFLFAAVVTLGFVSWFTASVGWPNLDGAVGLVVYVLTETGSARYVSVVLLAALGVWILDPGHVGAARRRREAVALFAVMIVALPTTAFVVERVLKPVVVAPRPSHARLATAGVIDDLEAFYALDKPDRRKWLRERTSAESIAREFDLHRRIAAHWLHEAGSTLPSAHALNAFLAAVLFVGGAVFAPTRLRRWVAFGMLSWATLVAWTRVALLVHRPFDVTVGALLGCAIGTLLVAVWWKIARIPRATPEPGEPAGHPMR